jgi:hypothetical protein
MSNSPSGDPPVDPADELLPKYHFDYSKARPNRFAASCPPGGRLVVLEPDIAQVFTSAESVNSVLRALIATMPPVASR